MYSSLGIPLDVISGEDGHWDTQNESGVSPKTPLLYSSFFFCCKVLGLSYSVNMCKCRVSIKRTFPKRVKWDQGSQKARCVIHFHGQTAFTVPFLVSCDTKPTTKTRFSYCFHLGISWDFRPNWLLTYKTSNEINVLAWGKLSFYRPMHRNMNHLKLYTFSIRFL